MGDSDAAYGSILTEGAALPALDTGVVEELDLEDPETSRSRLEDPEKSHSRAVQAARARAWHVSMGSLVASALLGAVVVASTAPLALGAPGVAREATPSTTDLPLRMLSGGGKPTRLEAEPVETRMLRLHKLHNSTTSQEFALGPDHDSVESRARVARVANDEAIATRASV